MGTTQGAGVCVERLRNELYKLVDKHSVSPLRVLKMLWSDVLREENAASMTNAYGALPGLDTGGYLDPDVRSGIHDKLDVFCNRVRVSIRRFAPVVDWDESYVAGYLCAYIDNVVDDVKQIKGGALGAFVDTQYNIEGMSQDEQEHLMTVLVAIHSAVNGRKQSGC